MAVSSSGNDDDVMSTINITPFTDVLLVLLIIFIILAAVTKEPHLPDAKNADKVQPSRLIVLINDKNKVQIGSTTLNDISEAKGIFASVQDQTNHIYTSVIVKADPKADFGTVLQVMDAAKQSKLTNFGLANHTEGTPTN